MWVTGAEAPLCGSHRPAMLYDTTSKQVPLLAGRRGTYARYRITDREIEGLRRTRSLILQPNSIRSSRSARQPHTILAPCPTVLGPSDFSPMIARSPSRIQDVLPWKRGHIQPLTTSLCPRRPVWCRGSKADLGTTARCCGCHCSALQQLVPLVELTTHIKGSFLPSSFLLLCVSACLQPLEPQIPSPSRVPPSHCIASNPFAQGYLNLRYISSHFPRSK
jgi:hypothetical protein